MGVNICQASMHQSPPIEQKVKAEQQNNPAFDKAASEKRNRRMLNRDRQWVAHQLQQRAQQAPQALGDDQELCSGSCGCLGTEKRRDCLAAGFPIPLISYILSFFSRMG